MAKMFYTIDETADKLGVSEEQIRKLAGEGKLQQFRDRDKLMFKREQVDALASEEATVDEVGDTTETVQLADTGTGDTGDTDRIDLAAEAPKTTDKKEDSRMATGISVFDADEIEMADPLAQTVVTPPADEEELALESVGSGSGLLDLTRESDDTSLGAELLDEIYPGSGEGSDLALEGPSSSGAFDEGVSIGLEGSATGLEHLQTTTAASMPEMAMIAAEPDDPAGNGLSVGMLFVAMIAAILAMVLAISGVIDVPVSLTDKLAGESYVYVVGGLGAAALIFGVVGFLIGSSRGK